MPNSTLFFMHIPKTAGTSVHRILELNFLPWKTYSLTFPAAESQARFAELPRERRNGFALVKGHFPYGFHEHVDTKPSYVSFVREPLSRVLSDYNYRCTVPFLPLYDEFRASGFAMQFYLQHLYIPNLATLFFAGVGHLRPCDEPMDLVFDRAMQNLDRFDYVGTCEDFDGSIEGLAATVGLKRIAPVRTNVTPSRRKTRFTAAEARFLVESEQWDLRLYDVILRRNALSRRVTAQSKARRLPPGVANGLHYAEKVLRRVHLEYCNLRYRPERTT
jgi:hypothetical protein